MAVAAHGVQDVEQARGQSGRGQGVQIEAAGQTVGGEKAQPLDVQGQLVGVGGDHLQGLGAIALINLPGVGQAHPQPLQGHHHVPHLLAALPVPANLLDALGAEAGDLFEALRLVVDHLQGVAPEMGHQAAGQLRADALDQPRGQVLFDARHRGRQHRVPPDHLELLAPLGVHLVGALEVELLALLDPGQRSHHGDGVAGALNLEAHHGVMVFGVGKGEALHGAFQGFERLGGDFRRDGGSGLGHWLGKELSPAGSQANRANFYGLSGKSNGESAGSARIFWLMPRPRAMRPPLTPTMMRPRLFCRTSTSRPRVEAQGQQPGPQHAAAPVAGDAHLLAGQGCGQRKVRRFSLC